jgi:hypothetical protein
MEVGNVTSGKALHILAGHPEFPARCGAIHLTVALWFCAEQPAAFNAYAVGAIIAVMALMALFAFQAWEEWVSGLLGAWLVISPWVLGFAGSSTPVLTHVAVGVAAIVLAIWSTNEHEGHLTA